MAGCGVDRDQTTATTTAEPARSADLPYPDVAGDYAKASGNLIDRGREVVDRLVAGDIASVYVQASPRLKAQASLAEVERAFAEERARAPIGPDWRSGSSSPAPRPVCTTPTTPKVTAACASRSASITPA